MTDEEFNSLKEDIRANGQIDPIWTHEGKIIDGRNRARVCAELGISPKVQEWNGEGSLIGFIVSRNVHRRHLSQSQKAVIALDVLPLLEKEARQRQKVGAKLPEAEKGRARDIAASILTTSPRYVAEAKAIQRKHPELLERVRDGRLNLSGARELSEMDDIMRVRVLRMLDDEEFDTVAECRRSIARTSTTRPPVQKIADERLPIPTGDFDLSRDPEVRKAAEALRVATLAALNARQITFEARMTTLNNFIGRWFNKMEAELKDG